MENMEKELSFGEKLFLNLVEFYYISGGIVLSIGLPFINYLAPHNSLIGRIRFPISLYAILIGSFYLVTGLYIARRKRIGLKLALIVNIMGIPLIFPITIGLVSLIFFRANIKKQFKE